MCLVVEEGKTGDKVVVTVESGGDEVLTVVTNKLKEGKHGDTSVLELRGLAFGKDIGREVKLSGGRTVEAVVVNSSDSEDDLSPAKERDGVDGGNSVRDIGRAELSGDEVISETVGFRGDVSEDGKHGNTSVLEFRGTVLGELLFRDSVRETGGVPESNRGEGTNLVFEGLDSRGGTSYLGGGESSGGAGKGSEDSELHHLGFPFLQQLW